MLDLSEDVLKAGRHGCVFCFTLKFSEGAHALILCKDTVTLPGGDGDYKEERELRL